MANSHSGAHSPLYGTIMKSTAIWKVHMIGLWYIKVTEDLELTKTTYFELWSWKASPPHCQILRGRCVRPARISCRTAAPPQQQTGAEIGITVNKKDATHSNKLHKVCLKCFGSVSRRAKMTHKNRTFFLSFMFWSAGCSLLGAEKVFSVPLKSFMEA